MYPKSYYSKGKWTDRGWVEHKLSEMSILYLWNVVLFITECLPYVGKNRAFWVKKRLEVLKEIDRRASLGDVFSRIDLNKNTSYLK